ncbi:transmembrane amino acid transporter protein-domain-containing protein [Cladochytrium replicatum]|nr:transmembrane amino acid transporter protein-domain-containing protein [Cladochytrium replicatum]
MQPSISQVTLAEGAPALGVYKRTSAVSVISDPEDELQPLIIARHGKKDPDHASSKASFWQSVLNTVNLLVGTSLLSLPYTLKTAGWIPGLALILLGAIATLYTTHLLRLALDAVHHHRAPRSLGDLATHLFGPNVRFLITFAYVFELFACGVSYVIVVSDTLGSAGLGGMWVKVLVACVMVWMSVAGGDSMARMSFGSAVGVGASAVLLVGTVVEGLVRVEGPGSLWMPERTRAWPVEWEQVWINLGIVLYTYSGHSVFPSIYSEMRDRKQFMSMMLVSYLFSLLWFLGIPVCCYIMYGDGLKEEFSLNLWESKGGHWILIPLHHLLLYLLIIIPTSKYSLVMNPLAHLLEVRLPQIPVFRVFIRTSLGLLVLATAIAFPRFTTVVASVGALCSFSIAMVFPAACHLKLCAEGGAVLHREEWEEGGGRTGSCVTLWETILDWVLIFGGVVGGVVGAYGASL